MDHLDRISIQTSTTPFSNADLTSNNGLSGLNSTAAPSSASGTSGYTPFTFSANTSRLNSIHNLPGKDIIDGLETVSELCHSAAFKNQIESFGLGMNRPDPRTHTSRVFADRGKSSIGDNAEAALDIYLEVTPKFTKSPIRTTLLEIKDASARNISTELAMDTVAIPVRLDGNVHYFPLKDVIENLRVLFPHWQGLNNLSAQSNNIDSHVDVAKYFGLLPEKGDFDVVPVTQAYRWNTMDQSKDYGEGSFITLMCSEHGTNIIDHQTRAEHRLYLRDDQNNKKSFEAKQMNQNNLDWSEDQKIQPEATGLQKSFFMVHIPVAPVNSHQNFQYAKTVSGLRGQTSGYTVRGNSRGGSSSFALRGEIQPPQFTRQELNLSDTDYGSVESTGKRSAQRDERFKILITEFELLRMQDSNSKLPEESQSSNLQLCDLGDHLNAYHAGGKDLIGSVLERKLFKNVEVAEDDKAILETLCDPISMNLMTYPLIINPGKNQQVYDRESFNQYAKNKGSNLNCPLTCLPVTQLRLNEIVMDKIQHLQAKYPGLDWQQPNHSESEIKMALKNAVHLSPSHEQLNTGYKLLRYYGFDLNKKNSTTHPFSHFCDSTQSFGYTAITTQTSQELEQEIREDLSHKKFDLPSPLYL